MRNPILAASALALCCMSCISVSVTDLPDGSAPPSTSDAATTAGLDAGAVALPDGALPAGLDAAMIEFADAARSGADASASPLDASTERADASTTLQPDAQQAAGPDAAMVPDGGNAFGLEIFVATDGDDKGDGSKAKPFATLERAGTALKGAVSAGLPTGGAVIWLRGGVYERAATFQLDATQSGTADKPVAIGGYPGESVRLVGGSKLNPSWLSAVDSTSPVWSRLDPLAQGSVFQVDLGAHGITDYGVLSQRGFADSLPAALEVFIDGVAQPLARWPDVDESTVPQTPTSAQITVHGTAAPDITGTFVANGTSDGVNSFMRQGLVGGKQYYFYRYSWTYQGSPYTAWFLTTSTSGYPTSTDPWWYRYSPDFGELSPSNGATGNLTIGDPTTLSHGYAFIYSAVSDTTFEYAGNRPARWASASDIWFHGFWKYQWADLHIDATSIDTGASTITLSATPGYGIATGQPYYAENLLEEITTPGEWYLDRATGILYVWPPKPPAQSEIVVSTLAGPLIKLNGASSVSIQDLTLEIGRSTLVEISNGSGNTVRRCLLRNAGTDALHVTGSNNGIERSEVTGTGDGGATLGGGDRASLTPGANFVRNCHLHDLGRWSLTYHPAVYMSGAGHQVTHNLIESLPHTAVLFIGNEHLIEFNEIRHVCTVTSDAGAIYTGRDWGYRGNIIRYNFIHDVSTHFSGAGVQGVYLDDCVSGLEVFGNILYRIQDGGIEHGGGRDDIMHNNIIARCGTALSTDNRGTQFINNTPGDSWDFLERLTSDGIHYQSDPWLTRYPPLAAIPNDWATDSDPANHWLQPGGAVFSKNLGYANSSWIYEGKDDGTSPLGYFADVSDNVQDQDPQFVDEASLNLALKPTSPAYSIPGWVTIPFDSIGIQP